MAGAMVGGPGVVQTEVGPVESLNILSFTLTDTDNSYTDTI